MDEAVTELSPVGITRETFGENENEQVANFFDAVRGTNVEKHTEQDFMTADAEFLKAVDEGGTENLTKSLGEGSLPSLREVADYVNREDREEGDFSVSLTDEALSQKGEVLTDEKGQNVFEGREFNLKEIDRPSRRETEKAQKEGYEGAYNPLSLKEGKVEAMFFDNTPLRRVFGKQSGIIEQSAKPYLLNKHIQKVQETLNINAPTQFVRELYQNARHLVSLMRRVSP